MKLQKVNTRGGQITASEEQTNIRGLEKGFGRERGNLNTDWNDD